MMFRRAQADEESGSDWDEYSPQPSPQNIHTPKRHTSISPQAKRDPSVVQDESTANILPLETELTSLATAATPPTHPLKTLTPPTTKYTVEDHEPANDRDSLVEPVQHHDRSDDLEYVTVNERSAEVLSPYFKTTNTYMGRLADKSEHYSQRCSDEVFSAVRIVSDFIIVIFLSCVHYFLHHITNKLCCGLLHICTDTLFKPLVHVCFNGLCWPILSLFAQVSKAIALILQPFIGIFKTIISQLVPLVNACKLVHVNISTGGQQLQHV